jgi:hypothetical protein
MIVSVLIGLTLILSTFVSTVSIVQKMAYAQARMAPSINGVPVPNSMTQRSTVVGSNAEPGRSATGVQGVAGALSSVHGHLPCGNLNCGSLILGPRILGILQDIIAARPWLCSSFSLCHHTS